MILSAKAAIKPISVHTDLTAFQSTSNEKQSPTHPAEKIRERKPCYNTFVIIYR